MFNYYLMLSFAGNCNVLMSNGKRKKIFALNKGDQCATPDGFATVVCIVMVPVTKVTLVRINTSLSLMPDNYVKHCGYWIQAKNHPAAEFIDHNMPIMYSVVLDQSHCINVGGILCATLGYSSGDACGASIEMKKLYVGTSRIVRNLASMAFWNIGMVILDATKMKYDRHDRLISLVSNS